MINYTSPVAFSDPQSQTLTLAATGVPAWLTFTDNGNGTYTVTGTAPATGSPWMVSVVATDTDGNTSGAHVLTIDCGVAVNGTTGPITMTCANVGTPIEPNVHCGVGDQGMSPLINITSETICGHTIRAFGSGEGGIGARGTIVILESATPLTIASVTSLQVDSGPVVMTSGATFTALGGNLYQWAWTADVFVMGNSGTANFTVTYVCP